MNQSLKVTKRKKIYEKLQNLTPRLTVGTMDYPDVVAIEFDSVEKAKEWYHSSAYQSLVPIREKGAEIILQVYE